MVRILCKECREVEKFKIVEREIGTPRQMFAIKIWPADDPHFLNLTAGYKPTNNNEKSSHNSHKQDQELQVDTS